MRSPSTSSLTFSLSFHLPSLPPYFPSLPPFLPPFPSWLSRVPLSSSPLGSWISKEKQKCRLFFFFFLWGSVDALITLIQSSSFYLSLSLTFSLIQSSCVSVCWFGLYLATCFILYLTIFLSFYPQLFIWFSKCSFSILVCSYINTFSRTPSSLSTYMSF